MIEANLRNISSEMRFRHWHENPTELCEITLKVVHSFSQQEAGWLVPLAQRSGLSGVRKAALQAALPSSLALLGCHPPGLPSLWFTTICPFQTHEHH